MTADYKKYLAERVLNEQEHVTYRALSRALKVHCNQAKRMLYDFHRVENAKKSNSVKATYIIIGTPEQTVKRPANGTHGPGDDGGDEIMQSSPFMSSQVAQPEETEDTTPVTEVRLVREEELSEAYDSIIDALGFFGVDAKSQFKNIFSIFVYSVQSTSPQDLNVLADLGHTILESQPEDPLECGPRYGMIQNKSVKRRARAGPPPAAPPAATAEKPKATKPKTASHPVKQEPAPPKEEEQQQASPAGSAPAKSQTQGQAKSAERASQSKRDNASIFKAFAKAKPKSEKQEETSNASAAEPQEPEDVVMGDDESEEEEREDLFLDTGTRKTSQPRESRRDREAKLKQMMEDEDMPDVADEAEEEDNAPEKPSATDQEPAEEAPAEPEVSESSAAPSGTRRRRGRRQVMRKKTTRDADGYLVTREEPEWESFSEDEAPAPPKRKPAVSGSAGKSGKAGGGGKGGQGNIMSFFGKKP